MLLACLLLAACCLRAKPGRSTLDTKKGYKTKTGSTSSVTLIKTEYWDRAGGVVPILLYVRTTVFPSPHFALATGFRFTAIPLLHECHCLFCFPLPPFEFASGFRFTAIPLSHECHCLFCIPLPLYVFANGFRFTAIPFIVDCMSSNICSCA